MVPCVVSRPNLPGWDKNRFKTSSDRKAIRGTNRIYIHAYERMYWVPFRSQLSDLVILDYLNAYSIDFYAVKFFFIYIYFVSFPCLYVKKELDI